MPANISISIQQKRKLRLTIRKFLKDDANKPSCDLTGLDNFISTKIRSSKYHAFWLLLFLFCTCMLTYQTHDRMMHYLSRPVAVDVTSTSDNVKLPDLLVCGSNTKEMVRLWNKTFVKLDTAKEEFSLSSFKCVNMMKTLMANQTYNMDELWKATNITKEIVSIKMKGYSNESVVQTVRGDVYGICSAFKFATNSSKSFVGKSLTVKFEKINDDVCPSAMYYIGFAYNDFGKKFFSTSKFSGTTTKINLSYDKYIFLNSSENTCSSENEYKDCYFKCLAKKLRDKLTCRLPFINNTITNLPLCECSNTTHELYAKALEIIISTDAIADCSCRRQCQQLSFTPNIDAALAEDEKITSISLEITNEKMYVYNERYSYDVIALLSDLGGNLGLFLGLSLISFSETIWYLCYKMLQSIRKKRHVYKIQRLYEICKKIVIAQHEPIKTDGILLKLKLILVAISTGFTLYYLKNRLNYYNDEPVTKTVTVVQRAYTEFPSVTVCGENKNGEMDKGRLRLMEQTNKICSNISPWKLFNDELPLEDIWDSLNVHENINLDGDMTVHLNGYATKLNVTKKLIPLPFGNCSQVHADNSKELTVYFLVSLEFLEPPEECEQELWYFMNPPEEDVDILRPMSGNYGSSNVVTIRVFKTIRRNLQRKPCEINTVNYFKCIRECKQNNLFQMLKCRLPYMLTTNLPLCNTTDDVTNAHSMYLRKYNSNQKECKCKQPCTKTFYQTSVHEIAIPVKFYTFLRFGLSDNFIETITEKEQYPIAQLLSDVGSILGLTLGMSLLSLYICILETYNWFRSNITSGFGRSKRQ